MPNLNYPGESQAAQNQTREKLNKRSQNEELFSVECIRHRARVQTEQYEWKGLKEAGQAQLKRRSRDLIYLVDTGDNAYLDGKRAENACAPDQPEIPIQER